MKVLIIGGGGREHALAWKVAQSPRVHTVYVAPGNAGTALEPKLINLPIAADAIDALLEQARREAIGLTIVGPEVPLVGGVVDRFEAAGLPIFGPTRAAAELEGSKAFCKAFLERHRIPTAAFASFDEVDPALAYVREHGAPIVVKADGLAAGKGVVVAHTLDEAERAVVDLLGERHLGVAGQRIVIEEYLEGEEVSFIVMVDGEQCLALATSQDHKARDDQDRGPNTGGMGAYSPAPLVDGVLHRRIMAEVIEPTIQGLIADGRRYRGFLYAGLMIAGGAPKVLEYNCRLGDPETQPIMMRLQSDLVEHCLAALDGSLHAQTARWDPRPALGVVLAAGGYPASYRQGDRITGLDDAAASHGKLFHAGTRQTDQGVVTAGGRVLCATALGENISAAQLNAYELAGHIRWDNIFYRRDIGYRAIARARAEGQR